MDTGIEATLFELPPVAAIAGRRVEGSPFAARLELSMAIFFKDSIPDGHDVVIVANVMHSLKPDPCLELLRRDGSE